MRNATVKIMKFLVVLAVLLYSVSASAEFTPFFFIQLSDPQFGCHGKSLEKETRNAELVVKVMNKLGPRFVVITGDLVHAFPGHKGRKEQVRRFWKVFSKLERPLYLVPGNHDVGNYPTARSIAQYKREFRTKDRYVFTESGVKFMALNSSLIWMNRGAESKRHERWMKKNIDDVRLVFQHHQWFIYSPHEKNGYFNLPKRKRCWLRVFGNAGVDAVLAGHFHHNIAQTIDHTWVISTSSLSCPLKRRGLDSKRRVYKPGFRVVTVRRDGMEHMFYDLWNYPEESDFI